MKFRIAALIVASTWVLPIFCSGPPETFSETHAGGALEIAAFMEPSDFTVSHLEAVGRSFIDTHPKSRLIRYVIFTDLKDGRNYFRGLGVTDWEFPAWRHAYLRANHMLPATAEMIRIANRSSIRIRFQDGMIEEHVLTGGSPFDLTLHGMEARLLAITFHGTGMHSGDVPDNIVSAYVQTAKAWDKQLAERFSRLLRARAGFPWLELHLEDGWWFAGDPGYPLYNRFLPYFAPPKFSDFRTHTRFYCNAPSGECSQTGPAKE